MLEVKTRALILEREPGYLYEGHLIAFTRDRGIIRLIASGLYRDGAKLGSWTDPPTLVDANLILPPKGNFGGRLASLSPISFFEHIQTDYESLAWFYFYVFLIKNFLPEGIKKVFIFNKILEVLKNENIWEDERGRDLGFSYFLVQLLKEEGICPTWKKCVACEHGFADSEDSYFSILEQGLLCKSCLVSLQNISYQIETNLSLSYLKILPEKYKLIFPKNPLRVGTEERDLLLNCEENPDFPDLFANIKSSPRINDQTFSKVRNFLLLFLGTVV